MLAGTLRWVFGGLLALASVWFAVGLVRRRQTARFRTDQETLVNVDQPLAGLLHLEASTRRTELIVDAACRITQNGQRRPRSVAEGARVALPEQGTALVIQPGDADDEPMLKVQSTSLHRPAVITAIQWCYDALVPLS
ncbi:MAG: hypothetical protein R3C18_06970 [Planctomycetaceae bacterium]